MQLNDAIIAYVAFRRTQHFAESTIKSEKRTLRQLMEANGNVLVRNLSDRSVERLLAAHADWKSSTYNRVRAQLASFFKWARQRNHMARDNDPLSGYRQAKITPSDVLFVPRERFPTLLDTAEARNPRDRALVAIGLYAFLRAGEMASLVWQDIDLDDCYINLHRFKTHDRDRLPICEELWDELIRWQATYSTAMGQPCRMEWTVVPPLESPGFRQGPDGKLRQMERSKLRPMSHLTIPHEPVQIALANMGYGTSGEGGHTLRRSGAYALYQTLAAQGNGRAGRIVQAMLGHKHFAVTESYLRLSLERQERDDILRGQPMFGGLGGQDSAGDIRLRHMRDTGEEVRGTIPRQ